MTVPEIARAMAMRHGIPLDELRGPARRRAVAWPRQEAMWMCRQVRRANGEYRHTLNQIGMYFGGRDHSTVVHAIQAVDVRIAESMGWAA